MNYSILKEHYGIDPFSHNGEHTANDELRKLFLIEEENNDMEVDFSAVVRSLLALTKENDYEKKHKVLSNLGYLLSHNAPSLEGHDEKLNTDKDFADILVLLWQSGENDERIVDQYLEKAQKLLK